MLPTEVSIGLGTWIAVPLLGALIGYITNRLAVKMIFRPIEPVKVFGVTVQGLMGKRQKELAASIGRVVGKHLIDHDDIVRGLSTMDMEGLIGNGLDEALSSKLGELRKIPLVGNFLTDERIGDLKQGLIHSLASNSDALADELARALEEGFDIEALVAEKVSAFPIERLEELVLEVSERELRAIEVLGGVLGFLIGLGQVALLGLL
ncbi:MAG: uncharacterized membrane protein YheB (UPF0754 family) [Chlamydiales bacterium]|jgi:uncharacterized membrane protein YheB (UPF0754 family)